MQSASVNYVQASSGAGGTWAAPLVRADWFGDGFGSGIDDLSRQAGSWTIEHHLDDGYPDSVTFIAGVGYGQATVELGPPPNAFVEDAFFESFERGVVGWSATNCVFQQTFLRSYGGRAAGDIIVTGSPAQAYVRYELPVVAGRQYTVSMWVFRKDGYADVSAAIDWYNSSHGYNSTSNSGGTALASATWELRTVTGVAPVDGYAQFGPTLGSNPPTGVTMNVDDVSFSSTLSLGLVTVQDPMQVAEYFSPYNEDSPIYGLDRDIAPVTLDHGVITGSGPERIRVFTGQMADIPVKGGKATLTANSATRTTLSKLILPPVFPSGSVANGGPGLNGTWPVTWALYECGLYASPPPRTGCRWYVPAHGSMFPFIPAVNHDLMASYTPYFQSLRSVSGDLGAASFWRPTWVPGPYLLAPDCQLTADESRRTSEGSILLGDGDDLLSQAGNKGRLEFWARCDTTDVNNAPGGSGTVSRIVGLRGMDNLVSSRGIFMGINNSRQVFIYANDGAGHSATLTSTDTMPTDGVWRAIGAAYDLTAKRLWVRNFDGTTTSSTVASFVTSSLPTADTWDPFYPNWTNYVPVAEIQLTAGAQANVDDYPTWFATATDFTPTAVVTPSQLELSVMAETAPREAWEFIASYAQGELAAMRTDENDIFNYLGQAWWVRDEQQQVVEVYSTDLNTAAPDINTDVTKIRNSIRVAYSNVELGISSGKVAVFKLSEQLIIPPGVTVVDFTFSDPVVYPTVGEPTFLTDVDLNPPPTYYDYITLNTAVDGTGSYANNLMVSISKLSWYAGGTTWQFTNTSGSVFYTANASNAPALQITGYPVKISQAYVVDSNDVSVARRGERSLPITATSAVQTSVDARRLARELKMGLRKPTPIVEELTLFGEARRQPGDLITFSDPSLTKASGLWRTQSVKHTYRVSDGAIDYTNAVILRPTLPICVVGEGIIGASLVGPST